MEPLEPLPQSSPVISDSLHVTYIRYGLYKFYCGCFFCVYWLFVCCCFFCQLQLGRLFFFAQLPSFRHCTKSNWLQHVIFDKLWIYIERERERNKQRNECNRTAECSKSTIISEGCRFPVFFKAEKISIFNSITTEKKLKTLLLIIL